MPKVSVIVPNYNHANFLEKRLESILKQICQDFEVIILDDYSTDHSRDIIEQYRGHPKVRQIIYNEVNSGSTFFQWNKGIELAAGELIWIAESDDTAEPVFLAHMVESFESYENLVIAYVQSNRMNDKDEITGTWENWTASLDKTKLFKQDFFQDGATYIKDFLIHRNTIPNASAVLFKKQSYLDVGGAVPELRTTGDWEIWLKLLTTGNIYYKAQCLNNFRYHQNSVIARFTAANKVVEGREQLIKMYMGFNQFLQNRQCADIQKINTFYIKKHVKKQVTYKIRKHLFQGLTQDIRRALNQHWLLNGMLLSKITLQLIYFSTFKLLIDKIRLRQNPPE